VLTGLKTEQTAAVAKAHPVEVEAAPIIFVAPVAWRYDGQAISVADTGDGAVLRTACYCFNGSSDGAPLITEIRPPSLSKLGSCLLGSSEN
jgi:hypothetical protein